MISLKVSSNQASQKISCAHYPCRNGGRCTNMHNSIYGYQCDCVQPWTGRNCELSKKFFWENFVWLRFILNYKFKKKKWATHKLVHVACFHVEMVQHVLSNQTLFMVMRVNVCQDGMVLIVIKVSIKHNFKIFPMLLKFNLYFRSIRIRRLQQ